MEFRGQQEPPADDMDTDIAVASTPPLAVPSPPPSYHECLRNHAATLGGHVLDGCGEFMPGDDALRCAACACHRSFHRKGDRRHLLLPTPSPSPSPALAPATPAAAPLLLPPPHPYAAAPGQHHQPHYFPYHGVGTPSGTTTESSSEERGPPSSSAPPHARRKRFRTRFTPEQKDAEAGRGAARPILRPGRRPAPRLQGVDAQQQARHQEADADAAAAAAAAGATPAIPTAAVAMVGDKGSAAFA